MQFRDFTSYLLIRFEEKLKMYLISKVKTTNYGFLMKQSQLELITTSGESDRRNGET